MGPTGPTGPTGPEDPFAPLRYDDGVMAIPPDTDALAAIRTRMEAAENAGDPEPIIDVLADDAVIIVPTFPVSTGRIACAAFLRDLLPKLVETFDRRVSYVSDDLDVRGDLAIDRGLFSFTVRRRAGGAATVERGKYVFISRKDASSNWQLWRAIATLDERDERRPRRRDRTRRSVRRGFRHAVLWCNRRA